MDFIIDLPLVQHQVNGGTLQYNGIFTLVDRLTKYVRLVPCYFGDSYLNAGVVAKLFFEQFVRFFAIPKNVVHDRDPRFTSAFWQAQWKIVDSRSIESSSHYPQTDGQTEKTHRTLEQVIRAHFFGY